MCRQCDDFEPAVMDDILHDSNHMRAVEHIARAREEGRLCMIDSGRDDKIFHQCAACRRVFILDGTTGGWTLLTQ